MDIELTKDAEYLLDVIYDSYRTKIKEGMSKVAAKKVDSAEKIQSQYLQQETIPDIHESMNELWRAGFLKITHASNIPYKVHLEDKAIIYMENRIKRKLQKGIDIFSKLR